MKVKQPMTLGILAAFLAIGLLASAPARADLGFGETQWNTDVTVGPTSYFVNGLPSWYTSAGGFGGGGEVIHLTSTVTGGYAGTADSGVFYLNGSDASGGLGFAYQVSLISVPGGVSGLEEIDFTNPGNIWDTATIGAVGSDGSGTSSLTGGTYDWADGDPIIMSRLGGDNHLGLNFYMAGFGGPDGTYIDGSAGAFETGVFWYEAPRTTSWMVADILLENSIQGQAPVLMIPAPAAVLLGALGLGMVGWMKRRFR